MTSPDEIPFAFVEGALVIRVKGPLTMQNTNDLRSLALAQLAAAPLLRGLVIDLSGCDYIDSTGIGAFIVLKMRVKDALRFRLCAPTALVQKIFKTTRFDLVVPVDASLADGLAALPVEAVKL